MSLLDQLKTSGFDYYKARGLKVYLKTDVTPEFKIFDSDAPTDNKPGPIKYSITLRDKEGKKLFQHGETPNTDLIKSTLIYGALGVGAFVMLKGLISFFNSR